MTALAQIALEFCRDCLGWEDTKLIPDHIWHVPSGRVLWFADLNAVMAAVRKWCSEKRFYLEINTTTMWNVHVCFGGNTVGFGSNSDFGHALLAACVEASRKLKAA